MHAQKKYYLHECMNAMHALQTITYNEYMDTKVLLHKCMHRLLFCQSIRRVNCVIGRTERHEVAYIAREPSGQLYRRLCHLFRTKSSHQKLKRQIFIKKE
ncbi:hypothetical protein LOAG_13002 [Loa loa]|uniref:Uncharacterized protein n=1 Tax=Loa loa TaxID=7209 RepID=A0A1S0TK51_LOALO|nr:hypothetical protein LOAG_13002 [Loa loa]EFO15507.1 hypothetical protein LOAG_13002 [Loa loa]